ncbi:MAG TPA: redoxin family protein [Planctomycetota bacterium]|nr:redoxin family protein [Planctomycetota bacterium]
MRARIPSFLFITLLSLGAAAGDVTLKPGDAAPKLYASKWLNGEPVSTFEKGKIYVIECWATWCGPCRAAIPHVNELHNQFKDKGVIVIGMAISDRAPVVESFVAKMGSKMSYRVAIDEPGPDKKGLTLKSWMSAVGQNEIPWSFIVDKAGVLAWVGDPSDVEPILHQLLAGTYDVKKQPEIAARRVEFLTRLEKADSAKDGDAYLKIADEMIAFDPSSAGALGLAKFKALLRLKKDYVAAYALANKLFEHDLKMKAEPLAKMAEKILEIEESGKRDLDLALKLAQRADELAAHENAYILETLAAVYFQRGDRDKAISTQEAAVKLSNDEDAKETLAKYKAK